MADVIDLRKNKQILEAEAGLKKPVLARPEEISFSWEAREYDHKTRSTTWHLFIGGIATALVIVGIFSQNYFFIIFVALAYAVFMMYEKKMPSKIGFSVSAEGVITGRTLYRFSELKSFWIFTDSEPRELSLETSKTLSPFLRLPLKDVDPKQIHQFLKNFLPEIEHKELITDQIEKSL